MSEEKRLILEMVKAGKISVSDAEKLLESTGSLVEKPSVSKSVNRKFLKILVIEDNVAKVNITIPIALAEVGLKLIPNDKLKIEGKEINLNEILNLIQDGSEGELVNIDTMDGGKDVKVRIFIE